MQYDINREAAKISALSSEKIDKYEYLTGEEILPSDQKRVIEQATFTYSPLGKVLEKQRKTIGDQDKNQMKALEEHGKQLIKSTGQKDSFQLLKQKEIFHNERRFEINKLSEGTDFNSLVYIIQAKVLQNILFVLKAH